MIKTNEPVAVWSETEIVDGQQVQALVGILRGRGCFWASESGCLMCGYSCDTHPQMSDDDLLAQVSTVLEKHDGQQFIKLYTSGSFFDGKEMPATTRNEILAMVGAKATRLLIESRPEFIKPAVLETTLQHVKELEVAIGLETASDEIRSRCVNKGFSFADFEEAAENCNDAGASVRTYLLLKPPYLTERQAIEDAVDSAIAVDELSDTISFNPVNVQRHTEVENLWKRSLYRPPWLWSLLEVLKRSSHVCQSRLMSAPSGGGSPRGVHNCRNCDRPILDRLALFSLDQNVAHFDNLSCKCYSEWLDYLELGEFMGTTGDLQRLSEPR